MPADAPRARSELVRGHELELYEAHATRLLRIVARQVQTTPENIEDACHFAWVALLRRADCVQRDAALAWLAITATRNAYKLHRRQGRDASLDVIQEDGWPLPEPSTNIGPQRHVEIHEDLDVIDQLPARQQRIVWLKAAGLSYTEIADYTGDSIRTVQRQILRARSQLGELRRRTDLTVGTPPTSTPGGRKPPAAGL